MFDVSDGKKIPHSNLEGVSLKTNTADLSASGKTITILVVVRSVDQIPFFIESAV